MTLPNAADIVARLKEFQSTIQKMIIESRRLTGMHEVTRSSAADTIYAIDAEVEPIMEDFFETWGKETPLILVAEGLEGQGGVEEARVFPSGATEAQAKLRIIVDPIDGTRGIMYDKRSAWALAGVAPNKGPRTTLRDIEVAVMTELPTSKLGYADTLWGIRGQGMHAERVNLFDKTTRPLQLRPSKADTINHGFATVSNFFPGTKVLAAALMEQLAQELIGPADVTRATVFEDQYISTGGQFYEMIAGHDRFNADLRPLFYRIQNQPEGLCCHPYDCATMLIAEEAGVVITDGLGQPLDGPLDTTTGLSWAAYANPTLREKIEPLLSCWLAEKGVGQ
jgi:fructose-1,6-bisphosphatase/inositol monophosphatase family enzyme